jgi:prepilin-type N-terminal cleavage/methylation domain-containing protein
MRMRRPNHQGFTLIEVLMTIVIIGILAAVAMRSVQSSIDGSRVRETQSEMDELIVAIAGNPDLYNNGMRSDFGYVGDVGALPSSLDDLVTNPGGYTTWRGPYVSRRFTQDADGFKKDAWGNNYTFTSGITLASTGGGSTAMTKSAAPAASDLTTTPIAGTVTDAAGNPPGDSSIAVNVTVSYPDGAGGTTSSTVNPSAGGAFTFNSIPVGVRTITAVYRATDDTVTTYAALLPQVGATVAMRLPEAPFAGSGGGGGGGSSGGIEFVTGSATSPSNGVQFTIWNSSSSAITVNSITLYHTVTAYYGRVRWNGTVVYTTGGPRAASGQVVSFSSAMVISPNQNALILVDNFYTTPSGSSTYTVNNVVFTVEFSDGSTMAFNSM